MSIPQHIVALLEDYLDGRLDHSGQEVLSNWAEHSDEHARELAAWFNREVELLEAARVADLCAVFEGVPFSSRTQLRQRDSAADRTHSRKLSSRSLAIAATILVAVTAAYFLWVGSTGRDGNGRKVNTVASNANQEPVPPPAILSRLANCVWDESIRPLRVGQDVAAGTTLRIKSGLAQLFFESGAKVVLMGPCELRVDDSMRCRLSHGSVSADVPPRAAGFTIRGPSSEVIDLGTQFGFSVGDGGKSEVHVFQGEVISRQLDERGQVVGQEIRLQKNQAILFPGERKEAKRLAADEAKFALEVRPLWKKDNIEPLVVDRQLALWLRAEHGVQTDQQDRVVAWQDLALGDNHIANDAFQPVKKMRPRRVMDAIHGRPTIRFDGEATSLTTTPMTTTDNQTIVVAFQYLPPRTADDRIGGQILNYNGPPSRFLPDVHSPGVLQLGEKIDVWNGPALSISAKAFVGRDSRGIDVSAGVVVSEALGNMRPTIVAYVYDNSANTAVLYVNGQRVAGASAPTKVAVTSRKVIGKHGIFDQWYFHGDLGELLIFNEALPEKEVKTLSEQLMAHYGIQTDVESENPNL
jgi:hypothetical protein